MECGCFVVGAGLRSVLKKVIHPRSLPLHDGVGKYLVAWLTIPNGYAHREWNSVICDTS